MVTTMLLLMMLSQEPWTGEREVVMRQPVVAAAKEPQLKLIQPKQVGPDEFFELKLDSNCKWHEWTIPAGLKRVPVELTAVKEKGFVGSGPIGVYEFLVRGSLNDVHVETRATVFIGSNPPGPLPPGPPTPPAPGPNNPLVSVLQGLYTQDKGTPEDRDSLCGIWSQGAKQVLVRADFKTMSQFTSAMHEIAQKMDLTDDDLKSVRTKLATEITTICGPGITDLGPVQSECRKKAADLLTKYAKALEQVR